ncbi:glycoside hydrolase family 2 protein [Roseibium sp.]|uniref:glycoside hydrolase family 2 protein n=1 Tax=Roseibium sp. TaxID=1936156 RepID=UPI003A982A2C
MPHQLGFEGDEPVLLNSGWRMALTGAGAIASVDELSSVTGWLPASVPGTVAGTLAEAGRYSVERPEPLHHLDAWYTASFEVQEPGSWQLVLDGLATIAEVYLDGHLLIATRNMFRSFDVDVELSGAHELTICFRALAPELEQKGRRARWRPQLATSQGLRLVRTTLLGHMPGWCPEVHAVGPWRPIYLRKKRPLVCSAPRMTASLLPNGDGELSLSVCLKGTFEDVVLHCAGQETRLARAGGDHFSGVLRLPSVEQWMPHTHGAPVLHDVVLTVDGRRIDLGRTGFRLLEVDRGSDGKGFGLKVNGTPVFCRGAVWTCADILNLSGDMETYRPLLQMARDAGLNMLRIGGTMTYETRAFFELCDELGILVWQDFQFANYDYPVKDEAFVAEVLTEATDFLERLQGCPSLAVLCGGSEIYQQGAMLGLSEDRWKGPLCEEILPAVAGDLRADVPYVPNSPCEGALPFSPNEGVAHYYGVGAYQRPLEDARRAEVRFAAECLAFSNVPEAATLESHLAARPGHDPAWKARVPRDRGAGWDFEDVRDFYLKTLYGFDPARLRYSDPDRYLDLSRAVTAEVMEATIGEWRRAASTCQGALVWTFQDLLPGPGWGLIDALGTPKSVWYVMKRACRPLQVFMSDEGTNGLDVHLINETPEDRNLVLTLTCLRDGRTPVISCRKELDLPGRSNSRMPATDVLGSFFDFTYAYRFGPLSHDVTIARLFDPASGGVVAESFHFPDSFRDDRVQADLTAELEQGENQTWHLRLQTDVCLRSVHLRADGFSLSDNWFHLAPGAEKRVSLRPSAGATFEGKPSVQVSALNAVGPRRV